MSRRSKERAGTGKERLYPLHKSHITQSISENPVWSRYSSTYGGVLGLSMKIHLVKEAIARETCQASLSSSWCGVEIRKEGGTSGSVLVACLTVLRS
ncbi:hypothetical protein TNCV_1249731 [Trichonephila clavipes]|nr:hypothetical protein TNCV_1249731 [Trichonephila clavipes]